jgi:hypothetical protein
MSISASPKEQRTPSLPIRVEWVINAGESYHELTRLLEISPLGATFTLARRPQIGQLVQLSLASSRERPPRKDDQAPREIKALVWALAEKPATSKRPEPEREISHVLSVIFVDEAPSAAADPDQAEQNVYVPDTVGRFRLYARDEAPGPSVQVNRRHQGSRINLPIDVLVEALDKEDNVIAEERTVTENISLKGAAVLTTLEVPAASVVRVTSEIYGISLKAIVCARRVDASGIARLHLAFVDGEWPLEGLS